MLFSTASPYWVWRSNWISWSSTSTIATGSYVASSISGKVYSWPYNYYITSQWNHYNDFINDPQQTLCKSTAIDPSLNGTTFYSAIGQYGWCDQGVNGPVNAPGKIVTIQGLSVATTICLFIASLLALIAPSAGGSKLGFSAAAFAFISCALSCAAFSVAVSCEWYHNLLSMGYLPVTGTKGVGVTGPVMLYWGPGFWTAVAVFIITFFAFISMCSISKKLDDDLDGTYGAGNDNMEDPIADYGGQAGDYAYGVDKA